MINLSIPGQSTPTSISKQTETDSSNLGLRSLISNNRQRMILPQYQHLLCTKKSFQIYGSMQASFLFSNIFENEVFNTFQPLGELAEALLR